MAAIASRSDWAPAALPKWRATDFSNGRVVALKRFTGALASADAERLRAELELLAAHALHGHPNVVDVLGGGSEPEPHVVMEYLTEATLAAR